MFVHCKSYLQFGPDPVGAADKNRMFVFEFINIEEGSERTYLIYYICGEGRTRKRFDNIYQLVPLINVNTCFFVS